MSNSPLLDVLKVLATKEKSSVVSLRIPLATADRIDAIAAQIGCSRNILLTELVKNGLVKISKELVEGN